MVRFGSHFPVLKAVLETFEVRGVIEIGSGLTSTPFFAQHGAVTSLETNSKWITSVEEALAKFDEAKIVHVKMNGLESKTDSWTMGTDFDSVFETQSQVLSDALMQYMTETKAHPHLDLLFVDQEPVQLRALSLLQLYSRFKIVAWHDAEQSAINYEFFLKYANLTDYELHTSRLLTPHTGVLVHKSMSTKIGPFFNRVAANTKIYCSILKKKSGVNRLIPFSRMDFSVIDEFISSSAMS
jgi:hypothetical protein